MSDITAKVDELAKRSASRKVLSTDEMKSRREQQWHELKTKAPEIAEFMIEMNRVFGKPASVKVWGNVVFDSTK